MLPARLLVLLLSQTPQEELIHRLLQKLPAFMEWLALRSDLDSLDGSTSAVTLMTAARAWSSQRYLLLAWRRVSSLVQIEGRAKAQLEEGARLAYVAITRARKRLYLTYASTRRTYGSVRLIRIARLWGDSSGAR